MKKNPQLIIAFIILLVLWFVQGSALTTRIKRLEADVEDLRLRVIYGVKP